MKIKKTSFLGMILALVLVTALAIGTLSVFATDGQPRNGVTFEGLFPGVYSVDEIVARAQADGVPILHSFSIMCAATGEITATMDEDEFAVWREENAGNIFCHAPHACTSPFCPSGCGEGNDFMFEIADYPYLYNILSNGLPFIPNKDYLHPDVLASLLEAINNRQAVRDSQPLCGR